MDDRQTCYKYGDNFTLSDISCEVVQRTYTEQASDAHSVTTLTLYRAWGQWAGKNLKGSCLSRGLLVHLTQAAPKTPLLAP